MSLLRTSPHRGRRCLHVRELQSYDWPGNIRELQNVIERAVIVAGAGALEFSLPHSKHPGSESAPERRPSGVLHYDAFRRMERDNLIAALTQADWRISGPGGAANLLGLKPTTLASKLKAMKIRRSVEEHRD